MTSYVGVFLDTILKSINDVMPGVLIPRGGYSGSFSKSISYSDPVITNPYAVTASFSDVRRTFQKASDGTGGLPWSIILKPGQSYSFQRGTYNDPSMHQLTAQRLNNQTNQIRVNEAGIDASANTSARQTKSVLATMDELYWGDVRTTASSSGSLPLQKQAEQGGVNMGSNRENRTILGTKK